MAIYQYRCAAHGAFDRSHPIGSAAAEQPCPTCHSAAPRVFTAVSLTGAARSRTALIDRTEQTRERPAVVSAPPPRRGRGGVTTNPKHRHLPRP
ncbi:zinc ribbon domain-containing protein [Saccharopolyspora cebuensis]|uniref:Zinc ribbon domain-containing protein n=1 Tax=Saccharopolyspora cebuensis TaxID=418759 RepID=A0ABV4CQY1_9PSEU